MTDLSKILAGLSPAQRDLFLARLRQRSEEKGSAEGDEAIPRRPADLDAAPLSSGQERLWFLEQLNPEDVGLIIPQVVRLRGRLEVAAFAAAFAAVVGRHEALRTTFGVRDGRPLQIVSPAVDRAVPLIDLAALPPARLEGEARRVAVVERERRFDLGRGPLVRLALLRLAAEHCWALISMHHIVSDGWSLGVLMREMGELYAAARAGRAARLPALAVQYPDYAVWQRARLAGPALERQLDYWRRQLDGAVAVELPADGERRGGHRRGGARFHRPLPAAIARPLFERHRRAGATPFVTLAAAFAALLARQSGHDDVAFGSVTANRGRREVEPLIGFFVNTQVLRVDLSGDPPFDALVERVRRTAAAAMAHQDLPFERLVEALRPERSGGGDTPLFRLMMLYNEPFVTGGFPGLAAESLAIEGRPAQFDLTLVWNDTEAGPVASWDYDPHRVDSTTILRLAGRMEALLAAVVAEPAERISALPLASRAEHHQVVREWNDPPIDYAAVGLVHELFALQAARRPQAVALAWDGGSLLYGELEARANRLAHRLRAAGVGPEVRVGICAERSPALVVGLLAILKAGGAYVPLDPAYPAERLLAMVADSGAELVLGDRRWRRRLPAEGIRFVDLATLDELGPAAAAGGAARRPPSSGVLPDNAVYAIYTSGSTGRPKGVVLSHRAVANRLCFSAAADLDESSRMLQKTTPSFDVSVAEIFGPLLAGGVSVLARPGGQQDAEYLVELMEREAVTHANFPPSLLAVLLDGIERGPAGPAASPRLASLERVVTGSETVPADLVARFHRRLRAELLNRYGPTEAAVAATSWRCAPGAVERAVPIGRPIARAEIFIVDRWGSPAPVGVAGELLIGGVCLARGYLGDPALTAERFVPRLLGGPFGAARGERLYRSGDLARYRRDGGIEFLGRIDGQVKIRGSRVELGEIEAALRAHPAVGGAAVAVRGGGADRRLIAFWVATAAAADGDEPAGAAQGQPGERELRAFLAGRLPDFMVPASLARLEALPLLPNGKVDRRRLADLATPEPSPAAHVAPRTPLEELIAGVWADVLGRERVGVEESFFDLGGHSLLATRVASRLRADLSIELPLRRLFEAPTVAALAAVVERERGALAAAGEAAPPLVRVDRGGALPASFAQERLWFLDRLEPGSAAYHLPLAVRLRGSLAVPLVGACLSEIVRRHEALRTTFTAPAGRPLQVIAPPRREEPPLIDLSPLPAAALVAEARRLGRLEAERPFDLAAGPLFRAALLRLAEVEHVALFTLHHVVTDGWSMGVLIGDFGRLYAAAAAGLPSPLHELPIQYADFAIWQRGWLAGDELARQLGFWRAALAGAPAALDLATDRPRPAVQRSRGADRAFTLPGGASAALRRLSRERGATLFMTLLGGFEALLSRLTGQRDLVVGSTIANRGRAELEGLIGFFVNTLAMRADLSGEPSFGDLLARVRAASLSAYAHQDLPFEKLVEELRLPRDASRSPLFQVVFQMQNAPSSRLSLPGLELEPVEAVSQTAKFDLVLNVFERGEELAGVLRFNTDLFDATTAARLLAGYERLLSAAAAAPARRLMELDLLSAAERHQLVEEWSSGAAVEPPSAPSLAALVAAQAAARPAAVAVVAGDERLSYGGLAAQAGRLASRLAAAGVGRGDRVGLLVERSGELVVAVVGTLWAGASYVPLDPGYPEERLRFALADSGVAAVVGAGDGFDALALPAGVRRLRLEREPLAGSAARHQPPVAVGAADEAYVIYTSGSTGQPKGVSVTHGNVLRLLGATRAWFDFGTADAWTLFHSYAFDFSVWELWGALGHGGRLVVVPYRVSRSAESFLALLAAERVTVLNQTPSAFQQLTAAVASASALGMPSDLAALGTVVFGGERLEPSQLAPWWERMGDEHPRLINMYGITETTVHVTYRRLRAAEGRGGSPIGVPIPDLRVHLLDGELAPVPIGAPGEIAVGGAGVARGYVGLPERTAERFVPDPFGGEPGGRLYLSGDLARHRADGDLEVLGRIDRQVKVRGFRIELGEIEAALRRLPEVALAAVVARGEAAEERRLVACVVAAGEGSSAPAPDPLALRSALASALPDYMVPARILVLPELPLTANGKLDGAALERRIDEAEAAGSPLAAGAWAPPATAVERFLADLFGRALQRERIGLDDDFFALGGHSLSGAVLINQLQQEIGEIVQVVTIFDHPTVRRLAAYLAAEHASALARRWPEAAAASAAAGRRRRVDEADAAAFRALVRPLAPAAVAAARNPPAILVLAPPRSGTTLLRVMLAGHPRLFAPPELELLSFNTLAERAAAFAGRDRFWLEGAVRAVMEIRGCGAEAAADLLADAERGGLSTRELYGRLQAWLGPRMLVDKTPSYALDPAILRRAEEAFERPLYLHLVRHPYGMIRSFEEAKLDQIFFRREHRFTRRELAELIWRVSQENILEFLAGVPAERHHRVGFEDLVARPEEVLAGICGFLGIPYEPAMARPYEERRQRMTDGIHAESRMLGDVKFHQHRGVERAAAERWKGELAEDFLGDGTWRVATSLGYERRGLARIPAGGWSAGEPLPLSFAQERLWFLDQLEPGNATYNIPLALTLAGRLAVPALAASLAEIVRRHAALRTTFAAADGRPVQVIAAALAAQLALVDLGGLAAARSEAEARRLAAEEAVRPFDLARGPLVRAALLRLAAARHVALFNLHHIVADGWSMGVLVGELGRLYAAAVAGLPSPLAEPPIQYADFAVWQRGWLAGDELARQLGFWRAALAGAPAALDLATDRPRPAVQRYRGASRAFTFGGETAAALRRLSRERGATLFMTLLGGFEALLSRLTGQRDLVVGSTIANRGRAELEVLIGFFVNTLAMRADLSGEPSFGDLLARVRAASLAAYAHQDLPFEKLVEELRLPRDASRTPLFQVVFQMQNAPSSRLSLPGLELEPVEAVSQTAKFDLVLNVFERGEELAGVLRFNTDLFDGTTAARLSAGYERLLSAAAAAPARRLAELTLLSAAERHQLVDEWSSGAAVEPPAAPSLAELVAAQAAARPAAVAVVAGDERLSYGGLAAQAGRLASRLAAAGVGRGDRVGLLVERSGELVVAVVGTLWAGASYVPLDPGYPEERLRFALADSGVAAVVGAGDGFDGLALPAGVRRLRLEREPLAGSAARHQPPVAVGAADEAYVIYTSGSTGRPKGVSVTHGNVLRLLGATRAWFDFGAADAWTLFHSYAFDFSVWELWGALGHGGRLVVVPYRVSRSAESFLALLAAERVTVLNQTPSAFQQLTAAVAAASALGMPSDLAALGTVVFGGERLEPSQLAPWWERMGDEHPRLINMYGITETTVHVTYRRLRAAEGRGGSPIGVPIPDLRVHLLDGELAPVPIGAPGEIAVGGAGVARGYVGLPERTAERFVPDPFGGEPGGRLYLSGDLARHRADGDLEVLGRIDRQVKVRGFRIELGEIEAALRRLPEVALAAVVARGEAAEERRLIACVVAAGESSPDPLALRAALAAALPDYMVPARVLVLPELPLTANGKLDGAALERWIAEADGDAGSETARPAAGAEPATAFEAHLAELFARTLRRGRLGLDDDFFAAGGNSILGAVLINRLQQELGEIVHVVTIFDHPTVRRLAAHLAAEHAGAVARRWPAAGPEGGDGAPGRRPPRAADAAEATTAAAGIETELLQQIPASGHPEGEPMPLSFAQERLWFLDQLDPGNPTYNVPLALALDGPLALAALAAAFAATVRRHAALRTRFGTAGGRPAQIVEPPSSSAPLSLVDLAGLPAAAAEAEGRRIAREEALRPFELERGRLVRAAVVRLAAERHLALFNLHHIVADGWSMGVLLAELGALYRAALAGEPSPLAPLCIQYADFAVWQRGWLAGERLERELAHWRRALAGLAPLELPADRPRPPVQTFRGGGARTALPAAVAAGLAEVGRRAGATRFVTLLAAAAAVLARHAGQDDVAIGTAVANRGRAEVEGLIGFFVNTLVLRADCAGDPTFAALLGRVRADALDAFAHQDLPFERIVEELNPRRDASRTPLFQVMVTLTEWEAEAALPGLATRRLEPAGGLAKFDLSIAFGDTAAGLGAVWSFNRDLFDRTTVARLAAHFELLAAAAAAEPERTLSSLPLLSPAERAQLAAEWNDGATDYPRQAAVHELVAAQAARRSDAVALAFGAESLTYGELAARSAAVARGLRAAGVGAESPVALFLPRGPALIVATLAILRAGGAYVPIDPAYPRERVALLLDDVGARVVVTADRLRGELPASAAAVVSLEACYSSPPDASAPPAAFPAVDPRGLAYVLYTSGSTGRPKGVAVPHRAVVRLVRSTDFAQLGEDDRVAQIANPAFDAATFEIWGALANGGCLVGIAKEVTIAARELAAAIGELGITALFLTSSLFAEVAREAPAAFAAVRHLLAGGEAVEPAAARRVLAAAPPARLLNGYGPTENTTFTACHLIGALGEGAVSVPIGRPIANTTAYVLDDGGEPVPIGVHGELAAGGDGLARGYFGRPELTAERFVPDGVSGLSGARLYRTGDRVRAAVDGTLDYLGRRDGQVKIRGFRIELGEIEAALADHPRVARAAVIVRGERAAERRLAAFFVPAVPEQTPEPTPAELRAFLRARLPEHMVPSAFLRLAALPLNANGKADRRALAALDAREAESPEGAPPRTAVEEVIAGFWAEVLGRERVGIEDDFFDLGGHSLLAAQAVSRVAATFQVELSLRRLFDRPTVAGLAAAVVAGEASAGRSEKVARSLLRVKAMSAERRQRALAVSAAGENGS